MKKYNYTWPYGCYGKRRKQRKPREGYKAFDIHNKRLLFYINMTAFIKKEHTDTTVKRHNEFIWWMKVNY